MGPSLIGKQFTRSPATAIIYYAQNVREKIHLINFVLYSVHYFCEKFKWILMMAWRRWRRDDNGEWTSASWSNESSLIPPRNSECSRTQVHDYWPVQETQRAHLAAKWGLPDRRLRMHRRVASRVMWGQRGIIGGLKVQPQAYYNVKKLRVTITRRKN